LEASNEAELVQEVQGLQDVSAEIPPAASGETVGKNVEPEEEVIEEISNMAKSAPSIELSVTRRPMLEESNDEDDSEDEEDDLVIIHQ
jgi:hypothetical protein